MSLHAAPHDGIPEQTIQVARAAFPNGSPSMRMRDALGPIYTHSTCAALLSHTGRPAAAPAQRALITIRQCAEGLSDAQAADAVRAHIDWNDALALDLSAPGLDASVLSEFRQRLIAGNAALLLCETLFTLLRERRLIKASRC
jgi:transposase